MKTTLLRIVAGVLTLGSTTFNALPARAGASADIGYLADEERSGSYLESNYSADLPLKARVSGFMDLMNEDQGYFGKTAFTRNLAKSLNARAQVISVNRPVSEVGFGLETSIPHLPKKVFASVNVMPLWADSSGIKKSESVKVGYFASVDLPKNFYAWSCGEIRPLDSNGTWDYGELEFGNKIANKVSVGVNFAMNSKGAGKMIPEFNPRLALRYQF